MSSLHGPIALSADGVDDFESAVRLLLKDKRIHQRWEEEEFWSLIVSAIATLPMNDESADIRQIIVTRITRVLNAGETLVAFPVANVSWLGEPRIIGDAVIGQIGPEWTSVVNSIARDRSDLRADNSKRWVDSISKFACGVSESPEATHHHHDESDNSGASENEEFGLHPCGKIFPRDVPIDGPVAFATWTKLQYRRAIKEGGRRFNEVIDIALLLENDPDGKEIKVKREPHNRPAVRGWTLDRIALEFSGANASHRGTCRSYISHIFVRFLALFQLGRRKAARIVHVNEGLRNC